MTTIRAYLGRSIVAPKCELTLPAELFASISPSSWLQVEDSVTRARYRVKVTTVAVEGCRVLVYFAQEIR